MTDWPRNQQLTGDLTASPVVWCRPFLARHELPRVAEFDLDRLFGPSPGHLIRTWPSPNTAPHWLATQGTKGLHTDPACPRWSIQVAIVNHGLALAGLDTISHHIPLGYIYCLDVYSPHRIAPHGPSPGPGLHRRKVQAVQDFADRPQASDEFADLADFIRHNHPTRGAR